MLVAGLGRWLGDGGEVLVLMLVQLSDGSGGDGGNGGDGSDGGDDGEGFGSVVTTAHPRGGGGGRARGQLDGLQDLRLALRYCIERDENNLTMSSGASECERGNERKSAAQRARQAE